MMCIKQAKCIQLLGDAPSKFPMMRSSITLSSIVSSDNLVEMV
uniref:Uncharacterized protein n=1 Tax=Arundo donax TaxID=35708 RepID=A0A0A8Z395_ARUDO